jgi:glycosyltransferase involved in cell wall biosynthesis
MTFNSARPRRLLRADVMAYRLVEIELSEPIVSIALAPDQDGCGLIARWRERLIGFQLVALAPGRTLAADELEAIADEKFAAGVLAAKIRDALPILPAGNSRRLRLSIAICTKDRAARLGRLLDALDRLAPDQIFAETEIIVVDNASVNSETRDVVARFPSVRYLFESKTGLNFARNAALAAATGDLIAYLDDDVVIDRGWLAGLSEAWRSCPEAGGFTGLVLPYRLDTEAQLLFELRGGFGRGFRRVEFRAARHGNPLHPVGSGEFGAGCNMAFKTALLMELGGFDEALDTGTPLPGGGDLDIFYRTVRSGHKIVYEPRYAVYHEHRRTIPQLRRQYWSWGVGTMAFLVKSWRTDPMLRPLHRGMLRWWLVYQLRFLVIALFRLNGREISFVLAELWGGIMGLAGEYDRSQVRVQAIRNYKI